VGRVFGSVPSCYRACHMKARRGYTLAEMIVVVVVLAIMAALAAPRLQFGFIRHRQAEMAAWKIVTDLRRTRSSAILEAASNPDGFAFIVTRVGDRTGYEIVDRSSSSVVDSHTIDSGVDLAGRTSFEFSPLGTLEEGYEPFLRVSSADRTFTISVIPATGMVKCVED